MVVANTRLYALFPLSAHTRPDDGLFDVVLFGGRGFFTKLRHVLGFFAGKHLQLPKVLRFTARTVSIRSARPLPVQVDGELIGTTPMTFSVQPAALRILLPRTAPYGYPDGRFDLGTRAAVAHDPLPP
jgi:diacylglycerol kinase family enzyme